MRAFVLVALSLSYAIGLIGERRMGLGVQFEESVLYRPDSGFVQTARLNSSAIQSQIERFLKEGKKPVIRRGGELQPEIVGLQVEATAESEKAAALEAKASEIAVETAEELKLETAPVAEPQEDASVLSQEDTEKSNRYTVVLLTLGFVLTLLGIYYRGKLLL